MEPYKSSYKQSIHNFFFKKDKGALIFFQIMDNSPASAVPVVACSQWFAQNAVLSLPRRLKCLQSLTDKKTKSTALAFNSVSELPTKFAEDLHHRTLQLFAPFFQEDPLFLFTQQRPAPNPVSPPEDDLQKGISDRIFEDHIISTKPYGPTKSRCSNHDCLSVF